MMEYDSSTMDFYLSAMEAYITLICAEDADVNIATEATVKKEPSVGSLLSTSLSFMIQKALHALRSTMAQILTTWKRSILEFTNKVLIPIRMNKAVCRDTVNIYQFIIMNNDRITGIPKALNKELNLLTKNRGDRTHEARYKEIEAKVKLLSADCDRWISHGKSVNRQMPDMVKMMNETNTVLKDFSVCEKTLQSLEASIEEVSKDNESLIRIRWLMRIFSSAFSTYNKILNQIVGSMSLTKSITNKIVNKVSVNKNADVDLLMKN